MCKKAKPETQTSEVKVPEYVETGGKKLIADGIKLSDKPFVAYTGDRVADFSPDQLTAFQKLRDLIGSAPNVSGESLQGARSYASAPSQSIGTERIVDENGQLGAISDYFNPHVDAALQPAIRKIMESADAQRKMIGAGATSSGAFGDARHGVVEGVLNRDTSQVVGDTAAKFYNDAWNTAMAERTSDLNRFKDTDTINANFNEAGLNRLLTGSGAVVDRVGADQAMKLNQIQALLSGGNQQQGNAQAELDAGFQEFLRGQGWDFSVLEALSSALNAAPYPKTQTTSKSGGSDNSILGTLGSIVGSVASSKPVAAAIASFI